MTSDHRISSGFIHDLPHALERHGYTRGDDLHAGRAVGLAGDLAHSCEITQDAAPSGSVVVPSSRPAAPQLPGPRGPDAVLVSAGRVTTLLAALDDAAGCKRDRAETCAGCAGQFCASCQWRLQAAEAYGQLAGTMSHAADAPAARRRAPGHASPPSAGPHAAADPEAGQ
jgi:hypothetical protein